jgi:ferrous iron transport protein A
MDEKRIKLGKLNKGGKGLVAKIGGEGYSASLINRLMEMGFLEGSLVEVMHESPFGKDPIAVRVRGALIALRRHEANAIEVFIYD